jgi:serine/threonine protein kinase
MGATLYAILSGRPPFHGNSAFEILMATVSRPHKPITEIRRDISPMTAEVIDTCLKKNAIERFQDGHKLQIALEQCLRHVGTDGSTMRLRK